MRFRDRFSVPNQGYFSMFQPVRDDLLLDHAARLQRLRFVVILLALGSAALVASAPVAFLKAPAARASQAAVASLAPGVQPDADEAAPAPSDTAAGALTEVEDSTSPADGVAGAETAPASEGTVDSAGATPQPTDLIALDMPPEGDDEGGHVAQPGPFSPLGQAIAQSHGRQDLAAQLLAQGARTVVTWRFAPASPVAVDVAASPATPVSDTGGEESSVPDADAPEVPTASLAATDEAQATDDQLVLANPEFNEVPVSFLVDGAVHTLDPGQTQVLAAGAARLIRYHRGLAFGSDRHEVSEGRYAFVATAQGWTLQPGHPTVPPDAQQVP